MTDQERVIYSQILSSEDKTKNITFYFGKFNYDLPYITIIESLSVGYRYIQTNIYTAIYNESGECIGEPCMDSIEEIIALEV